MYDRATHKSVSLNGTVEFTSKIKQLNAPWLVKSGSHALKAMAGPEMRRCPVYQGAGSVENRYVSLLVPNFFHIVYEHMIKMYMTMYSRET